MAAIMMLGFGNFISLATILAISGHYRKEFGCRNLLSRPAHRQRSEWGSASGSEGLCPAYSPELNPAEHVGSMVKMATANRVFETLLEMEAAIAQEMRPLWNTPARVHSLIGDNAVHSQTNASSKKLTSGFPLELV